MEISYKFKLSTIKEIVTNYNRVQGTEYSINEYLHLGIIEIVSSEPGEFCGCLLKDIAAVSLVFNWTFSVRANMEDGFLYVQI